MRLYNTLGQTVQDFAPRPNAPVSVYVCGITPYDTTHLGHAFLYVTFDVLIRHMEAKGWPVRYVQNVTDIDDDILRKSREVGEDWISLGNRWTRRFIDDLQALNVRPPEAYARATDEIGKIIEINSRLIDEGYAYERGGNVYFRVGRDADYGKLSQLTHAEMLPISAERGANPDDPNKENPLDFILWQAQAPGEPAWDSPWGAGRPGWHIECSAMSLRHLGQTVDIHGGGGDLIYPHHESEIAQSEAFTGREPFARFWFHAAMLRYHGEKMSKSLGNMVFARDLLKDHSADALRLALLNHHYRESWEFHDDDMQWAAALAERLRLASHLGGGTARRSLSTVHTPPTDAHVAAFKAALDDDLDTPHAIAILNAMATDVLNTHGEADELRSLAGILGLRLDDPGQSPRVTDGWQAILARFGG
ncbi:MAG: cysteine--tRNA ligase [Anaerolineae bacterium]|nr:cysteine--tRNA ligase [Anaerolineae bacterium]